MAPFQLDAENEESLQWSSQMLSLPAQINREVAQAKLDVEQKTMEYLRDIASLDLPDETQIIAQLLHVEKVRSPSVWQQSSLTLRQTVCLRHDTPPLMPMSPPYSPPALPSEVAGLEFTSTPEDLAALEAVELERMILQSDEAAISRNVSSSMSLEVIAFHVDVLSVYHRGTRLQRRRRTATELLTCWNQAGDQALDSSAVKLFNTLDALKTLEDNLSSPVGAKRLRDLKVEVPLTPQDSLESPPKRRRTMSIEPELKPLIPTPDSDESILDPQTAGQSVQDFVQTYMRADADRAMQQVEGEQLSEADTTMRVEVPQLEVDFPDPPWKEYAAAEGEEEQKAGQQALLAFTKQELLRDELAWIGVSKLERTLPWSPFPARLANFQLDEDLDDDKSAVRYLAALGPEDDLGLETLVFKAEGLRILDSHDSDCDELESVVVEEEHTVPVPALASSPPRVRQTQQSNIPMAVGIPTKIPSPPLDMGTLLRMRKLELDDAAQRSPRSVDHALKGHQSRRLEHQTQLAMSVNDPHRQVGQIGGDGISSFMRLQGISTKPPRRTIPQLSPVVHSAAPTAVMASTADAVLPESRSVSILPVPDIGAVKEGTQIVVPTAMLANRSMIRQMQTLLPGLDFVERELLRRPSTSDKASGQRRSTEADITVSPSVGILMTTLQKLKQKPLPGQTAFYGIRERVADVSLSYEHLIVFVSEGRSTLTGQCADVQALDERDCDALSNLMAHTAILDTEIDVTYVPAGEEQLAKCVSATFSRYAVHNSTSKLLADETLWERFLRTAGMNAFAAQAILSHLKKPNASVTTISTKSSSGEPHGLTSFLRMSAEQRHQQFGTILGGERVLDRVNKIVDNVWASAAMQKPF